MITVAIAVVVIIALYLYGTRTFNYWTARGVKHDKPIPFIGNNFKISTMQQSVTQLACEMYCKYPNEKVVGFFKGTRPELLIRDPEIAKRILTTDFSYFYPRGLNANKDAIEPLMRNLLYADGDLWRLLRQRMTPIFSTGKLKAMFPLVVERAEKLRAVLTAATNGEAKSLDARDLMARYTTDFIGVVGFGLDVDTLNDENCAFKKLGAKIYDYNIPFIIVAVLKEMFPYATKHLKYMYRVEKEFIDLVNEIQRQRNYEPSERHDFIDLLLECKKKGKIIGESIEKIKSDGTPETVTVELDEDLIAAQVFIFFAAGFETSSSATSFTLHQLAFHPEKQKRVQAEIDKVLVKYDGKLCYDAIKEMTYLECTFQEGLRILPPVGYLVRMCARKYTIPELDLTIDDGVGILIPQQAWHNDPQYFDNPEEFRPERFHPDEYSEKNKLAYLPFGEGPRACIGGRLGQMQSLAGLVAILSKFSVEPAPESARKPLLNPRSNITQQIKGGLPLIFRERVQ